MGLRLHYFKNRFIIVPAAFKLQVTERHGIYMEMSGTMIERVIECLAGKGCILVDLRTLEEYEEGHIRGAVNIPYEELEQNIDRLRGYQNIYLYCDRGNLSLLACRDLEKEGFHVINLWGGVQTFMQEIVEEDKKLVDYLWEI